MWRRTALPRAGTPPLAFVLLTISVACSSGGDTTDERHLFVDAAGRSCEAVLAKTSATSPPVSQAVECQGEGRVCSSESTPCFELNIDGETFAIRNCPACCRGSASSFVSSDCSPVLCETDADCVYRLASCTEGACTCPDGYCD